MLMSSFADPWHFGMDPDADPYLWLTDPDADSGAQKRTGILRILWIRNSGIFIIYIILLR